MVIEGNVLTGQQLITSRLKDNNSRDLPLIGQKEFQPTKSWLEAKQIQSALNERKVLIEEQRVEKWCSLSTAEWIPSVKKAKVIRKIGKAWEHFGHYSDDLDWLFPEEALLLLETNALELLLNELPLSIERAYVTLIKEETGCTLNEYRTFSHLVRLGYKVFRHSSEVSVTRYEKEIRLDQHVLNKKRVYANDNIGVAPSRSRVNGDVINEDCEVITIGDERVSSKSVNSAANKSTHRKDNNDDLQAIDELIALVDKPVEILIDDDDDDVVEVPMNKEVVVINDITSSDSEDSVANDNESAVCSDGSVCSRRSDSNWKRKSNTSVSCNRSPPPNRFAVQINYATANEFLYDPKEKDSNNANDDDDVIVLSDDDTSAPAQSSARSDIGQELQRFYKEIEVIDLESDSDENFRVHINVLSRSDILNSFPNYKNGEIFVKTPHSILLPPNIKPVCSEYRLKFMPSDSINTGYNDWGSHKLTFSNANNCNSTNTQRTQNHYSPRSHNRPFYQNRNRSVMPYYRQWNPMYNNNMMQSLATGVIQVASTLLSSLPFVSQSLGGMQSSFNNNQWFNQQPFNNVFQPTGFNGNNMLNNISNLQSLMNPYGSMQQPSNSNFNNYNYNQQNYVNRVDNNGVHNNNAGFRYENFRNQNYGGSSYRGGGNQFANRNRPEVSNFLQCGSNASFDRGNNIPIGIQSNQVGSMNTSNIPPQSLMGGTAPANRFPLLQNQDSVSNVNNPHTNSNNRRQGEEIQQNDSMVVQNMDESRSDSNNNNDRDKNRISSPRRFNSNWDNRNSRERRQYDKFIRDLKDHNKNRHGKRKRATNEPTEEEWLVIDKAGDPSVFGEDIPVNNSTNFDNSDFISFDSSKNNCTNNSNSDNNGTVEFNTNDYMDDMDSYERGERRNWRLENERGGFKKSRPRNRYYNSNRGGFKKRNYQSAFREDRSPNKRHCGKEFGSRLNNIQNSCNEDFTSDSFPSNSFMNNSVPAREFTNRPLLRRNRNERRRMARSMRKNEGNRGGDCFIEGLINVDTSEESWEHGNRVKRVKKEKKDSKGKNQTNKKVKSERSGTGQAEQFRVDILRLAERVDENSRNSLISSTNSINTVTSSVVMNESTLINNIKNERIVVKGEIGSQRSVDVLLESFSDLNTGNIKSENNMGIASSNSISEHIKREPTTESSLKKENQDNDVRRSRIVSVEQNPLTAPNNEIKTENYDESNNKEVAGSSRTGNVEQPNSNEQRSENVSKRNLSWAEIKSLVASSSTANEIDEQDDEDDDDEDDEDGIDDEEEIHPLVGAKDCKSLGSILSALQVIGSAELSNLQIEPRRKLKISYDVYIPKSVPFKKSSRGLPDFRLVIVDFRDAFPTPSEWAELNYRYEDGVPLLIATVLPDSVSFVMAATVSLPVHD